MKFLEKSRKRLNQPLIFVCSPYRGDVNAHVKCARRHCRYVVKQGGIPFAPHLLFTQFLDDSKASERRKGMLMGAEMLKLCDELWVFGEPSAGMQTEIDLAKCLGIPVRWKLSRDQRMDNERLPPVIRRRAIADQCDHGEMSWKGEAE